MFKENSLLEAAFNVLNEGKFPAQSDDPAIGIYLSVLYDLSDPSHGDYGDVDWEKEEKIVDYLFKRAEREHGKEFVDNLKNGSAGIWHFGRPNRKRDALKSDELKARKMLSQKLTKLGKVSKTDTNALKNQIKQKFGIK
jgi:hypothetical protein